MTFLNPSHQDAGSLDPYPFCALGRPGNSRSFFFTCRSTESGVQLLRFPFRDGALVLVCSLGCAQSDGWGPINYVTDAYG